MYICACAKDCNFWRFDGVFNRKMAATAGKNGGGCWEVGVITAGGTGREKGRRGSLVILAFKKQNSKILVFFFNFIAKIKHK